MVGLHAVHMAEPQEASLDQQSVHAQQSSAFRVSVLHPDVELAAKAVGMETFESPLLPGVGHLRLTAI